MVRLRFVPTVSVVLSVVVVIVASSTFVPLALAQQPGVNQGGVGGSVLVPRSGQGDVPPRDTSARRTGTSRLRGRVVAADTGQPLRRATVRASAPDIRESISTLTDANGVYELKDLAAGRYTVTASKGAYATMSYGQTRANEPGRPIEVGENQALDRLDVRLPRGGVIAGTIVDEFGDAVPEAMVTAYRTQFVQGRRRLVPAGRLMTTDDIGSYRLFGLPPGSYYLSASLRAMGGPPQERSDARSGYAPTYYPGTTDVSAAQRVTVRAGQTLAAINLALSPAQLANVSGSVVTANGEPVQGGYVIAVPRGGFAMMPVIMPSFMKPDGTFAVNGLAPGEYTITVQLGPNLGSVAATARATVSVNGQDISGVRLTPVPPAVLRGRLTLDGGTTTTAGEAFQLALQPLDADAFGPGGPAALPAKITDGLGFELSTNAARGALRLIGSSTWAIRSVRLDGADVTDGFDIPPGADLSGLELELTSQLQEVSGLVTGANGTPVTNYTVVLFAQDRALWTPVTRHIAPGRPDQQGRFRVRSLPPGDYYAAAVEYVEPGTWLDPEFLDSLVAGATSLSLNAGETRTLDLKILEAR